MLLLLGLEPYADVTCTICGKIKGRIVIRLFLWYADSVKKMLTPMALYGEQALSPWQLTRPRTTAVCLISDPIERFSTRFPGQSNLYLNNIFLRISSILSIHCCMIAKAILSIWDGVSCTTPAHETNCSQMERDDPEALRRAAYAAISRAKAAALKTTGTAALGANIASSTVSAGCSNLFEAEGTFVAIMHFHCMIVCILARGSCNKSWIYAHGSD